MSLARALIAELGPDDLRELAQLLAPHMPALATPPDDGYLNAEQASQYMATTRSRVYDLVQLGHLHPVRDGRRLLFTRADLDDYLQRSA